MKIVQTQIKLFSMTSDLENILMTKRPYLTFLKKTSPKRVLKQYTPKKYINYQGLEECFIS